MEKLLKADRRGQTVKLMRVITIVALCVATVPCAGAGFDTGNSLLRSCMSENLNLCLGYTSAISDAMGDGGIVRGRIACIPVGVTRGQVEDVAVQFLKQHPEKRHFAADSLVAQALSKAFPCP